MDPEVRCGGQVDPRDPSPRGEAREELGEPQAARALGQVVGDALVHHGEGQLAPRDRPIEADDVEAIAGLHGRRGRLTRCQAQQRLLKLGRGVAPGELTEAAAARLRGTGRVEGGQLGKARGIRLELSQQLLGARARGGEGTRFFFKFGPAF